jgi:hypothetical protein
MLFLAYLKKHQIQTIKKRKEERQTEKKKREKKNS